MKTFEIVQGDALSVIRSMDDETVDCVVTSPPYWGLRDYGHSRQMGLEPTPDAYVQALVDLFREVRRVLKPAGTLWLNLGDSYATGAGKVGNCPGGGEQGRQWRESSPMTSPNRMPIPGLKPKDLVGIPWRVALALQADGWWLRQDIIWHKPNPMPESVADRCTKAHEYVFLMTKSERYFYDHEAIKEAAVKGTGSGNKERKPRPGPDTNPGHQAGSVPWDAQKTRNRRDVWTIPTKPFKGAHFAVMPEALVEPCIMAGCPAGGLVLDPFTGSGTVGAVALRLGRSFVGSELNPGYVEIAKARIRAACPVPGLFDGVVS